MAEVAEVTVIRLVRELDAERKRRADAERSAKMARLRELIRLLTGEAAATKGFARTSDFVKLAAAPFSGAQQWHGKDEGAQPSLCCEMPPDVRRRAREGRNAVMRAEWPDPVDSLPSAARTARTARGYRGFDPLRRCLMRHAGACGTTEEHIVAADIVRGLADGCGDRLLGRDAIQRR